MSRKLKETNKTHPELTPLEFSLMQVVWERGNATAAEIGEALKNTRPLSRTTIHTVLANIRKKGFIKPIPTVERALRYAPCVEREQVARSSLRELLRDFFGSSPQRLMAHLIKEEKIGEEELNEIRAMLQSDSKKGDKEK